jgi:hypothetical protein
MLRKLFTIAALGIATSASLLAVGCASDNASNQPYGVTGTSADNPSRNPRYQDSKGHYHSEWVNDGTH